MPAGVQFEWLQLALLYGSSSSLKEKTCVCSGHQSNQDMGMS
jgi:hypothetical protein